MKRSIVGSVVVCLLAATAAIAQNPSAGPKPGAEHKKMEVFVGKWNYVGEAKTNPYGPAGKISGTDAYEMLYGGLFIQHHWDEKNPLGNIKGTEIWGYDPIKKSYVYTYISNVGEIGNGTLTVNGNTWTFASSGVTYEGKTAHSRGIINFSGTNSFTVKVDASSDGKNFTPAFEGKWTKQ